MVSVQPGHIAIHALGVDHTLLRHYKDNPAPDTSQPPSWAGVEAGHGQWCYQPIVISRVHDEYSCFLVNNDHHLVQSNFDQTMSSNMDAFIDLGGKLRGAPCVCNRRGTLHIFHVGLDHAIYHKYWNGLAYTPEEGFERLEGLFRDPIAAASSGPNEVSLLAHGATSGRLHHLKWVQGKGWHKEEDLPGIWAGALSAVSDQEGHLDVFGINETSAVNHVACRPAEGKEGVFSHYLAHRPGADKKVTMVLQVMPGQFKTVAAISCVPNEMDLLVHGYDSTLSHKFWKDGSWEGWEHFVGEVREGPWLVYNQRSLIVYSKGYNHRGCAKVKDYKTGTWSNWIQIEGILLFSVA